MLKAVWRIVEMLGLNGSRCPLCGTPKREPGPCAMCAPLLEPRLGGYCPRCGSRFGLPDYEPTVCANCRTDPPPWERLYVHGSYGGKLRDMVLSYKFAAGIQHAKIFQDMTCAAFRHQANTIPELIIPVPLHWKRLIWRGFNQSLELARRLARQEHIELVPDALKRTRHTQPQSTLPAKERAGNVRGAFVANAEKVKGRHVLLVDDVMTTGTTLKECTRVLRLAGASRVDVLLLARTQSGP